MPYRCAGAQAMWVRGIIPRLCTAFFCRACCKGLILFCILLDRRCSIPCPEGHLSFRIGRVGWRVTLRASLLRNSLGSSLSGESLHPHGESMGERIIFISQIYAVCTTGHIGCCPSHRVEWLGILGYWAQGTKNSPSMRCIISQLMSIPRARGVDWPCGLHVRMSYRGPHGADCGGETLSFILFQAA